MNNILVFNLYFINKIKNIDIYKVYEKDYLIILTYNNKN